MATPLQTVYKAFLSKILEDEWQGWSQEELEADLETIKKEIEQRDYQDMHRAISPLKKADDAIELDTSNMTLEEVVDQVLTLINKTREE